MVAGGAIHRGNFNDEFGIDVDCYVLDDPKKTAVISQRGMGLVLGLAPSGGAFTRFVSSKGMSGAVGAQLAAKIAKPIKFQWSVGGGQKGLRTVVSGYDVTLLIDVCRAVIQAEEAGEEGHGRALDQTSKGSIYRKFLCTIYNLRPRWV